MPKKNKSEVVSAEKSAPTISIDGWDIGDENLADLLEQTAEFLRENKGEKVEEMAGKDLTFKTVNVSDLFVVSHRS